MPERPLCPLVHGRACGLWLLYDHLAGCGLHETHGDPGMQQVDLCGEPALVALGKYAWGEVDEPLQREPGQPHACGQLCSLDAQRHGSNHPLAHEVHCFLGECAR